MSDMEKHVERDDTIDGDDWENMTPEQRLEKLQAVLDDAIPDLRGCDEAFIIMGYRNQDPTESGIKAIDHGEMMLAIMGHDMVIARMLVNLFDCKPHLADAVCNMKTLMQHKAAMEHIRNNPEIRDGILGAMKEMLGVTDDTDVANFSEADIFKAMGLDENGAGEIN